MFNWIYLSHCVFISCYYNLILLRHFSAIYLPHQVLFSLPLCLPLYSLSLSFPCSVSSCCCGASSNNYLVIMCVRTIVVSNKFIIDNSPFPAVKLRPCLTYDKMLAGRRISRINRLRASTSFYLPSAFLRLLANFLSRSQIATFPARLQKRVASLPLLLLLLPHPHPLPLPLCLCCLYYIWSV